MGLRRRRPPGVRYDRRWLAGLTLTLALPLTLPLPLTLALTLTLTLAVLDGVERAAHRGGAAPRSRLCRYRAIRAARGELPHGARDRAALAGGCVSERCGEAVMRRAMWVMHASCFRHHGGWARHLGAKLVPCFSPHQSCSPASSWRSEACDTVAEFSRCMYADANALHAGRAPRRGWRDEAGSPTERQHQVTLDDVCALHVDHSRTVGRRRLGTLARAEGRLLTRTRS